jgi:hypothetical protein
MARLNKPKRKDFTKADFDQYPVWVWDDEMEGHLPLSENEPSPDGEYGPFFIKARFEVNGCWFDGYLIGDETYYAFGLFVGDHEFVMNLNMPDLIEESVVEICRLMNWGPFELFPLRYESPVRYEGGREISGTLTL